jgi:hypothetical protein
MECATSSAIRKTEGWIFPTKMIGSLNNTNCLYQIVASSFLDAIVQMLAASGGKKVDGIQVVLSGPPWQEVGC